jgi:hypothetical protein
LAQLEQILWDPANVTLKLLVWTANILAATTPLEPTEWLEIRAVKIKCSALGLAGVKKIVLMKTVDLEHERDY